jgi:glycerol kinase
VAILAIDAGTTGVTALVISEQGAVLGRGYQEFEQHFPQPGWVEHDPESIWQATLYSAKAALAATTEQPTALGITNQRETAVVWHRGSLTSPARAIVWQDRRTAEFQQELESLNDGDWIRLRTGLNIDPYFTASKFLWWQRHLPEVWAGVTSGELALGTVDSYLIARLTGGSAHLTDASNASRTQLVSLETGEWDPELLSVFKIPRAALPEIVPSWGAVAKTDPASFLGLELPIAGIAGDQQAALFGQTAFEVGENKTTYGTGAFILTNTGSEIVHSAHGLLSTIAWRSPTGEITYASEGSVFVAGAAVQWLRDGLRLIERSQDIEALANSVSDSAGVRFVPALTGLGAPFWEADARGLLTGLTRGTDRAHIAFATLEAIAFQVTAVVEAMVKDAGKPLAKMRVDGGAAANNLLLQLQADLLGASVIRGKNLETTGLGAAFLAGLGTGVWGSQAQLLEVFELGRSFEPQQDRSDDYRSWLRAVEAARGLAG